MTIVVRAEFRVGRDRVDAFEHLAHALADAAATDPGALRYSWYVADAVDTDTVTFTVLEEYVDDDAAIAHNTACADLLNRVGEIATMTAVDLHGDLGPTLTDWVAAHPQARAHTTLAAPRSSSDS